MDQTEAKDIKERWQEYTEELYKKELHDPDNNDDVITHLEPDILECEVKWALESITTNKASGGDGIPGELFQTLKDDAVKVLHSICQQIWETQQWPQEWKRLEISSGKLKIPREHFLQRHTIKDRISMDLTEAGDIKKRWQEYTEEPYKKYLNDPDNHNGVITHLEPHFWNVKSSRP